MKRDRMEPVYGAAEHMAFPAEVLGASLVEITGYRQILLSGHKGIRTYSQTEIIVDLRECAVRVQGSGLGIQSMTKTELLLRGTLDSGSFIR